MGAMKGRAGALQGFTTRRRVTGSDGFTSHFTACYKITGGHTTLISHQTSRSHAIPFIQQGSPTAVMFIKVLSKALEELTSSQAPRCAS